MAMAYSPVSLPKVDPLEPRPQRVWEL